MVLSLAKLDRLRVAHTALLRLFRPAVVKATGRMIMNKAGYD